MPEMIDQRLTPIKTRLDDIGKDLHNFTIEIRHDELSKMVSELRNRIQEPFMFVIVGEVKAGKSSFINALLDTGKEICAVAPSPMTDTVQQIIYGTEKEEQQLNPYLKRIYLPVEILKEIAIVDTPGTNTIIDHHQEITERFIPASDLIVFVFEAKNPYRESAWKFFEFIHDDWRKKIVFILQQKDLLPENELEINKKGLIEQAGKKGMKRPLVFTVSAKDELEGRKDISGFAAVRDYIKENITGGQAPWLKLKNNITTFENILDRIAKGLDDREAQYKADVQFREEVKSTLDEQESISVGQVKHMVSSLLASYDAVTVKKEMEISSSLSMFSLIKRSFRSIFSKQQSLKVYLETLAASLGEEMNKELRKRLDENIADLAQSIQNMVQIVDLKIRNSENILTNDHDLFSNIAERRNNVLKDLQETFGKFLQETENFASKELFPEGTALSPNVLTGSGMAVIGVILTAVTHGMVFDITGGALTAIGLTFAGVSAGVKKRQLMKQFREEVKNGRVKLEENVTDGLTTYIASIKHKIDENFHNFDELLEKESSELKRLDTEFKSITSRLKETDKELDKKK